MQKSIFAKYFATVVAIISVCVIIFSAIVLGSARKQWIEEKNALLSKNVKIISTLLENPANYYGFEKLQIYGTIDAISEIIDSTIFLVDENGVCYYSVGEEANAPANGYVINKSIVMRATNGKFMESGNLNGALQERCFVVGSPVVINNMQSGVVFASLSLKQSDTYTAEIFKIILYAGLIVLLVAFVTTYLASAQLTKPLRQMAAVVKRIERGDFSARLSLERQDEIGLLADSINNMVVSIGALEGMRREFVSSVSHELKTPMTTISGFVDGILDGTIDEKDQSKYLSVVSVETKRLSRLVNSMLQLSRLESEKMKLNKTTFNLSDMIISVFLSFEQRIDEKKIEISGLDLLKPISITADKDLIYQVVYNLTENAIKFANEGGEISVVCAAEKGAVTFAIKNTGEGISAQDIPRIFDRFYKTDRSRSKDKTGMGFGLYIVKTIINLHRGKITVDSVLGEFTQFNVTLPDTEVVAEIQV